MHAYTHSGILILLLIIIVWSSDWIELNGLITQAMLRILRGASCALHQWRILASLPFYLPTFLSVSNSTPLSLFLVLYPHLHSLHSPLALLMSPLFSSFFSFLLLSLSVRKFVVKENSQPVSQPTPSVFVLPLFFLLDPNNCTFLHNTPHHHTQDRFSTIFFSTTHKLNTLNTMSFIKRRSNVMCNDSAT